MFIRPALSFIARDAAPQDLTVAAPCVPLELPMDPRFFICFQILWDECHDEKQSALSSLLEVHLGTLSKTPPSFEFRIGRLVQMQPEVGLAGPGGLSLFVRKSKGVDKSAGISTMLAVSSGSVVSIAW